MAISKFDGNDIIHTDIFTYTNSNPFSRKVSHFLVFGFEFGTS